MARKDIHRPSAITPEEYEYIGCDYIKIDHPSDGSLLANMRKRIREHMAKTGGKYSDHEHGGSCHVCGAHAIYTVVFYHPKSNSYIRTGTECAAKLDNGEAALFRKKIQAALEAQAGKNKALAVLEKEGISEAWDVYTAPLPTHGREEQILRDMVFRLVKYGTLSDKQINFAKKLLETIKNREVVQAKREAEKEAAAPVPVTSSRITIKGTVVSVKQSQFGLKMVVKTVDGWACYGSLMGNVQKGQEIEFDASITVSDRDPKFGFFKYPKNLRVLVR